MALIIPIPLRVYNYSIGGMDLSRGNFKNFWAKFAPFCEFWENDRESKIGGAQKRGLGPFALRQQVALVIFIIADYFLRSSIFPFFVMIIIRRTRRLCRNSFIAISSETTALIFTRRRSNTICSAWCAALRKSRSMQCRLVPCGHFISQIRPSIIRSAFLEWGVSDGIRSSTLMP